MAYQNLIQKQRRERLKTETQNEIQRLKLRLHQREELCSLLEKALLKRVAQERQSNPIIQAIPDITRKNRIHLSVGYAEASDSFQELKEGKRSYTILGNFLNNIDSHYLLNYCTRLSQVSQSQWLELSPNIQFDSRRKEWPMPPGGFPIVRLDEVDLDQSLYSNLFNDIVSILGLLFPDHDANNPALLMSLAGGGSQEWHHDFDPRAHTTNRSYACIYAVQDSKLHVFTSLPNGQYKPELVAIPANSILIFDADTIHAGAGYDKNNFRFHVYLDRKNETNSRIPNTTYANSRVYHTSQA
jgi:hypothetical protein